MTPKDNGLLYETGDRWKLDCLIPERDRHLIGPQIPRTSRLRTGTKVRTITAKPSFTTYYLHTGAETGCDQQARLRRMYSNDQPLEGDRLL